MSRYLMPPAVSILAVIVALTSLASPLRAEIPQVISYQGKVTDSGGTPVADGNYTMRFRIYDAASGGTLEWDSGSRTVAVSGGVFNVLLGESPQPSVNLEFKEDYWLSVTFAGVAQSPRQRLVSAGYAFMASGLVAGTAVDGSVTSGSLAAIECTNTAASGTNYGLRATGYSTSARAVSGYANAASGTTYGGYFTSASSSGRGVYGQITATTGITYGGFFTTPSGNGRGIFAQGGAYGGYFQGSASNGIGVYGTATSTTGSGTGVYGISAATGGTGVYGEASNSTLWNAGYGGWFETASHYGIGVEAYATNAAGSGFTYAVRGTNQTSAGYGVYGQYSSYSGTGSGVGGATYADAGAGVWGYGMGTTDLNYGVCGSSSANSGRGVSGFATHTSGQNFGVWGETPSPSGKAVAGWAFATTGANCGGQFGTSSSSGYGVYYTGGIAGTGSKSCVVRTFQGPTLFYCQESTECWFEDFGEGELVGGASHIELDPLFLDAITIDETNDMKVFVQLHDQSCNGVAVVKGSSGFDVIELNGGRSNSTFDYRVVAKRKGFETKRLDYCKVAETDPYLYSEYNEKLRDVHRNRQARLEREYARVEKERARQELEYNRIKEERNRVNEKQTPVLPEFQIGVEQ